MRFPHFADAMALGPLEQLAVIALALAMGLGGALIMRRRGRSGLAGFALGFLLGPIGLLAARAMRNNAPGKLVNHSALEKTPDTE